MDAVFFLASKLFWFFLEPTNVLLFLILTGAVLLWSPWKKWGRRIITTAVLLCLFVMIVPMGSYGLRFLENRFPAHPELPAHVDGIVVLGGSLDARMSYYRKEISISSAAERILRFAELAHRYPEAKLVYSGGSGHVFEQELKEADYVKPFLDTLGLKGRAVILENQSRNTFENAGLSYELVSPAPHETWVLITSGYHMPRSMGSFRHAGWQNIIAYPTDFQFIDNSPLNPTEYLSHALAGASGGLHEFVGLAAYYLTGKTDSFIPAP